MKAEPDKQQRGAGAGFISRHILPVILATLAVAAMVGGPQLALWLRYDRAGILQGEIWRVLTAHIMHIGWNHLLLNLAGLVLIWMLFGRMYGMLQWLAIILLTMLGVSLGLLVFNPEIHWYVGLSGVLHGLFVAGALASLSSGYRAELLLLGLLAIKLAWEQIYGALPASEALTSGTVVVQSHLYGALAGLIGAVILLWYSRKLRPRRRTIDSSPGGGQAGGGPPDQ